MAGMPIFLAPPPMPLHCRRRYLTRRRLLRLADVHRVHGKSLRIRCFPRSPTALCTGIRSLAVEQLGEVNGRGAMRFGTFQPNAEFPMPQHAGDNEIKTEANAIEWERRQAKRRDKQQDRAPMLGTRDQVFDHFPYHLGRSTRHRWRKRPWTGGFETGPLSAARQSRGPSRVSACRPRLGRRLARLKNRCGCHALTSKSAVSMAEAVGLRPIQGVDPQFRP